MKQRIRLIPLFLFSVIALTLLGFIFIYSASSVFALERHGVAHYYVKRQFFGLLLGLVGIFSIRFLPFDFFKKYSALFFIGSLGLTAATALPGIGLTIHGSHRWLSLAGIAFQPSELLKLCAIPYLAYILEKKSVRLNSFTHGYLPFICIIGSACTVLLKQPDFGQAVVLCLTAIILLFIARLNSRFLLGTSLLLIPVTTLLILFKPYRFKRILTFLHPWEDPHGAGFQIIQSLIAIGSGGTMGLGIAQSQQKFFYLPMQHTDFIFSIIAEETGFVGSIFVLGLYLLFLYSGIRIAWHLKNSFSIFVVLGFVLLITVQACINLSVATGLLPTKGIGLPFVSYGMSALIAHLCMVGAILQCAYQEGVR